jgi:hypothetical protein
MQTGDSTPCLDYLAFSAPSSLPDRPSRPRAKGPTFVSPGRSESASAALGTPVPANLHSPEGAIPARPNRSRTSSIISQSHKLHHPAKV